MAALSSGTQALYAPKDCSFTDWYSCGGGECHYMYTDVICRGGGGGGDYGGGGYHGGGGGGGGGGFPSGEDYGGDDGHGPPKPHKKVVEVIPHSSITNNPKANCIYGKLGPGNYAYDKFLAEFQKSIEYNVTFKLAPTLTDSKGNPANGATHYQTGNTNVIIFINSSTLYRPSFEVAATFVHEMAHAYLAQKLISIGGPGNLKQYATDTEFKDLFDYYTKYVGPETGKYTPIQNSTAHHNLMADRLITDIAEGIRDFVEANTPGIRNYSDITLNTYKAVSWNGLRETDAYTKLSEKAKDDILAQERLLKQSTTDACN